MNIDIRKSIYSNFENSDQNDIETSINDAIASRDEITLPGLGVFFELLWKQSSVEEQKQIVEKIKGSLK